jgi:hypothetical protein
MPTDLQNHAMITEKAQQFIAEGNKSNCGYPEKNICRGCNALQIVDRTFGYSTEGHHYIRLGWITRFKIWYNLKRGKYDDNKT